MGRINRESIVQNQTKLEDVQDYISHSFSHKTKGKTGKLYWKQIGQNIQNMILTKIHRIQHFFFAGLKGKLDWRNNESTMKKLRKDISALNEEVRKLVKNPEKIEDNLKSRAFLTVAVGEMLQVCDLLRQSGTNKKNLDLIEAELFKLHESNKENIKKELDCLNEIEKIPNQMVPNEHQVPKEHGIENRGPQPLEPSKIAEIAGNRRNLTKKAHEAPERPSKKIYIPGRRALEEGATISDIIRFRSIPFAVRQKELKLMISSELKKLLFFISENYSWPRETWKNAEPIFNWLKPDDRADLEKLVDIDFNKKPRLMIESHLKEIYRLVEEAFKNQKKEVPKIVKNYFEYLLDLQKEVKNKSAYKIIEEIHHSDKEDLQLLFQHELNRFVDQLIELKSFSRSDEKFLGSLKNADLDPSSDEAQALMKKLFGLVELNFQKQGKDIPDVIYDQLDVLFECGSWQKRQLGSEQYAEQLKNYQLSTLSLQVRYNYSQVLRINHEGQIPLRKGIQEKLGEIIRLAFSIKLPGHDQSVLHEIFKQRDREGRILGFFLSQDISGAHNLFIKDAVTSSRVIIFNAFNESRLKEVPSEIRERFQELENITDSLIPLSTGEASSEEILNLLEIKQLNDKEEIVQNIKEHIAKILKFNEGALLGKDHVQYVVELTAKNFHELNAAAIRLEIENLHDKIFVAFDEKGHFITGFVYDYLAALYGLVDRLSELEKGPELTQALST